MDLLYILIIYLRDAERRENKVLYQSVVHEAPFGYVDVVLNAYR